MNIQLFDNYSIQIAENANEFDEFFRLNRPKVFTENIFLSEL